MTRSLIYVSVNVFLYLCSSVTARFGDICPPGEVFTDCVDADCRQLNCADIGQNKVCQIIEDDDDSCSSGCICPVGFLRDDNGICIPEADCPEFCSTNEEFMNCTQLVCRPQNCTQSEEFVPCGPVIEDSCISGCVCISGTLRNNDGICVPEDQCEDICQPNEDFTTCVQTICRARDCSQVGQDLACPRIELSECTSGCVCSEGFVRDYNGDCIPDSQCPELICPANEEVNNCIQAICSPLNCSQMNKPIACASVNERFCITACVCKPGFLRNDDGICVPEENCSELTCPANEEANNCIQAICAPLNCSQINKPIACASVIEKFCITACVCKSGFLRNDDGICVPEENCSGELLCSENEVADSCPGNCSDFCPKTENDVECSITDVNPDTCGPAVCRCRFNFKRDDNGNCISTRDCPPFDCSARPNEEYDDCPSFCSDNCSQVPCRIIGRIGVVQECQPKCRCIEGFARNDFGICVPIDECQFQCGVNEILNECANECDNNACPVSSGYRSSGECIAPAICLKQCQCAPNFKRDQNGDCIPEDQCPGLQCGVNEIFNVCANGCDNDSCPTSSDSQSTVKCFAPAVCLQRCQCAPNFKRDQNGVCVPEYQCPGLDQPLQCNAPNEILSCVGTCPPEQTCDNRNMRFNCLLNTSDCQIKCICKPGFFRNAIGECISGDECDLCEGANEFFSCGQECDNVCTDLDKQNRTYCPIINIVCNKKCYCVDGFARDDKGKCVPVDQCPDAGGKCADPYEEFKTCKKMCPPDSCFSLVARFKCKPYPPCEAGCNCKPGYLRINDTTPCIPLECCPELGGDC